MISSSELEAIFVYVCKRVRGSVFRIMIQHYRMAAWFMIIVIDIGLYLR